MAHKKPKLKIAPIVQRIMRSGCRFYGGGGTFILYHYTDDKGVKREWFESCRISDGPINGAALGDTVYVIKDFEIVAQWDATEVPHPPFLKH